MRPIIAEEEDKEFQDWLVSEYVPISGGDGTDEGDSGTDDGTDESQSGTEEPKDDKEEPKDDKGVAFKNRLAEERRKREKAERELTEERALARARQEERERQEAEARKGSVPEEDDLASLQFSDPDKYIEKIESRAAERAAKTIRQEMSGREAQREATATLERLKDQFPELEDVDSDFYKEVDREYTAKLRRLGVQFDAGILDDTVQLIAYRKKKAPLQRSSERPPVGEMGQQRNTPGRNTKVSDDAKKVAKALGLSEKRVTAAYSRDLSGEIGSGTRH